MRDIKGKSLADRLQDSNKAKQALIKKKREAPKLDDPEVMAQRAAKTALLTKNTVERESRRARQAAEARAESEREAAAQAAKVAETERAEREEIQKIATLLTDQKAARDARYAARKKRNA